MPINLEPDHAGLKALRGVTVAILAADVLLVLSFLLTPGLWR